MMNPEKSILTRYRIFLSAVVIIYLALVAWLSLIPPSHFSHSLITFPGADKIVHGIIYLILGFLLFLLINDFVTKIAFRMYLIIFILASTYGVLMEFLQLWIRSALRSFEMGDIAANCTGVAIGLLVANYILPLLIKR